MTLSEISNMAVSGILLLLLIAMGKAGLVTSADSTPPIRENTIQVNISEGQDATLPCRIKLNQSDIGDQFMVAWSDPQKELLSYGTNIIAYDPRYSIERPSLLEWNLRIMRARARDAGRYTCQLNTDPVQEKSVFLYVQGIVTTTDSNPPVMEKTTTQLDITEGQNAILPCLINANPGKGDYKYTVTWEDPRRQLISHGTIIMISDPRYSIVRPSPVEWNLRIMRARARDAGQYTCQLNTDPVQEKRVFLYVRVAPSVQSSGNVVVSEGQDISLYCNVSGNPKPTLTWYRDEQAIPDIKKEALTIQNISRHMAGSYMCVADNGVKNAVKATMSITVYFAPQVTVYTDRIGQYRHKEVILVCRVVANPRGKITWYKVGRALQHDWKYEVEALDSKLENIYHLRVRIRSLEREDFGRYTCVAENRIGYNEVYMDVYELVTQAPTTQFVPPIKSTTQVQYKTTYRTTDKSGGDKVISGEGGLSDKDGLVIQTGETSPGSESSKSSIINIALLMASVAASVTV